MRVVAVGVFLCACAAVNALRGDFTVPEQLPEVVSPAVAMVELDSMARQASPKQLGVRGDLTVNGALTTSSLVSPTGNVKVSGELHASETLEAGSVAGALLKASSSVSITEAIRSKGTEALQILGKIDADVLSTDSLETSFLEIDGVRQWQLVSLEDFEEEKAGDGWSQRDLTTCAGNTFLGGPCTNTGNSETKKSFSNLPPHTQLRITAKYLFIDSWDGESAYMKVGDSPVWTDTYNHASASKGLNICGNDTPEGRYMRNIDVVVPHTDSTFDLKFGATTDEHACDESFGVDSVMIFVR